MSWTTIILAIIVIVLIYILYVYFISKSSTIVQSASLKGTNPAITSINSGQSTRYAYGIWVYVDAWNTTSHKIIFMRNNNISVYLDTETPTLYCQIKLMDQNEPQTITITDNFPLQAWTYVTISADNNIIDCYVDGKLVNSVKLSAYPQAPGPIDNDPVVLGSGWDAYVSGFQNWSGPIGPQQAWDTYMSGTGSAFSGFLSQYSINLSVDKNSVQQSSYTMNL
jgi:hypothetical protein